MSLRDKNQNSLAASAGHVCTFVGHVCTPDIHVRRPDTHVRMFAAHVLTPKIENENNLSDPTT